MPDAANPSEPGPPHEHAGRGEALELVERVIAWYTEQIIGERRAASPNEDRMERLKEQQRACVADQQALGDATPEEVARIATRYRALYKELTE